MKFSLILFALLAIGCSSGSLPPSPEDSPASAKRQDLRAEKLQDELKKIEPFFSKMAKPRPGDWLESHQEPGETFEEYLDHDPVVPTRERRTLYILPLGELTATQKRIVDVAAGYLGEFYDLPVQRLPPEKLNAAYPNTRINRLTKKTQVKTAFILDGLLTPRLPADAGALIAFTAEDLYPNDSMNYVFGQASLENRVGVWSLARLGDNGGYEKLLARTLKIAAHETGHMFSMRHCTKYECVMSGTNHLGETDRRPIDACPECSAKVCWLSDVKMQDRYRRLAAFCRRNGLKEDADAFRRKADALALER